MFGGLRRSLLNPQNHNNEGELERRHTLIVPGLRDSGLMVKDANPLSQDLAAYFALAVSTAVLDAEYEGDEVSSEPRDAFRGEEGDARSRLFSTPTVNHVHAVRRLH